MSLLIFAHPVSIVFGKLEQKRKEKHIFCLDKNKYLVFMSSLNLFLLGFFGTEPFERSLPVSVSDLSNLHVKLYTEEQFNSDSLCKLYLIPTFPDQVCVM